MLHIITCISFEEEGIIGSYLSDTAYTFSARRYITRCLAISGGRDTGDERDVSCTREQQVSSGICIFVADISYFKTTCCIFKKNTLSLNVFSIKCR